MIARNLRKKCRVRKKARTIPVGAEQIEVAVWVVARVTYAFAKNGEPAPKYSFWATALRAVALMILLIAGGFFK